MNDAPNTLFLRLEGPLQAWGDNSKFVIRRTMEGPTKSGVLGLICCAMGVRRTEPSQHPIPGRFADLRRLAEGLAKHKIHTCAREPPTILDLLNCLAMGVRIDRPGTRWWDYHTVGAKIGLLTAEGNIKRTAPTKEIETLISRREYLCDASFLVALQGNASLIEKVRDALWRPKWPLFLGRKSCTPAAPILVTQRNEDGTTYPLVECHENLESALKSRLQPWCPRYDRDTPRFAHGGRYEAIDLDCILEWRPAENGKKSAEPEVWYDAPVSFDPPVHEARLVQRTPIRVKVGGALQKHTPPPPRPRANYRSKKWREEIRPARLKLDQGLCVFCKSPATTVQHVTYRRAGGDELNEDLRSLCRLCHDAVTMIEYGLGMGLDRIDPEDPQWRDDILRTRSEIVRFRSEEARRRALRGAPERVRRELLEEAED